MILVMTENKKQLKARKFMTTSELKLLKQHYPEGGSFACRKFFPGMTDSMIQKHAWVNGIKCNKTRKELISARKKQQKQMMNKVLEILDRQSLTIDERLIVEDFEDYVERMPDGR